MPEDLKHGKSRGASLRRPAARSSVFFDNSVRLTSDSLHDLASPVNQIRTLTEMIVKRYRGVVDEDAYVMLTHLQNSAQRLDNLLAGLKTYLRTMSTREPYKLADGNSILSVGMTWIRSEIEQRAAVVTYESLPGLYCDPRQISCVFANLIENAMKFRSEQSPEIHISVSREQDFWVFAVRDNGIGIDARHHEKIFSAFRRLVPGASSGSGIGLALAKQIIEEHGGRIWVESQLGSGATFYFTLPVNNTV